MAAKGAVAETQIVEFGGHRLTKSRLQEHDFARRSWVATVDAGVPFEAVMQSAFWRHTAAKLTQWDKIHVRAEDGSYYAELLVVMATRTDAVVTELVHKELAPAQIPGAEKSYDGYMIKYAGPHKKWQVIREEDRVVLREGMASAAICDKWVADHKKAVR